MNEIENILDGPSPTTVFEVFNNTKVKNLDDKMELLENIVKTWEFFESERKQGRLHYTPNNPEDIEGLTQHIELSEGIVPGSANLQLNSRSLVNTYSFHFTEEELIKSNLVAYLSDNLVHNSKEYIEPPKNPPSISHLMSDYKFDFEEEGEKLSLTISALSKDDAIFDFKEMTESDRNISNVTIEKSPQKKIKPKGLSM